MSYGFCSKFRPLYSSATILKIKLDHPRRRIMTSYRFPLQDGGHGVATLLPVSNLVTLFTQKGRNLFADHQILREHGWYITTSGFENQRPPSWNFISGFYFVPVILSGL